MTILRRVRATASQAVAQWASLKLWVKIGAPLALAGMGTTTALLASGTGGSAATTAPSHSAPPGAAPVGSNPLDGVGTAGKVLAVKVDNVGSLTRSQQTGLNDADIVYWIQVEGGLSRFMAVYDSNHLPASVGPVRSARQTDLPILQQYGKVDFAYSGAISGFLPLLAQANVFNVTPPSGLFTHGGESPTFISPAAVFQKFPGAAQAQDIGFRFGPAPAGGTPVNSQTWRQPAAALGASWNGSAWSISQDGSGTQWQAHTIVVQHVGIVPGLFTDHNAGHPDNEVFSQTVGSGSAQVLRDGRSWNTTWSRPSAGSPTSFTLQDGSRMNFETGSVWVLLVP